MITTNVLQRTLHIKFQDNVATGFVIDVDNRQYLVTANHVASSATSLFQLGVFHDGLWRQIKTQLVGHCDDGIDITVMALSQLVASPALVLDPCVAGVSLAQDVFFLGYPYGQIGVMSSLTLNYPMPFVKKAIVSSMDFSPSGNCVFMLDGHNNPGFSGGPVVAKVGNSSDFKAIAVISAFQYQNESTFFNGKPTEITYKYNTGIIVAYSIKHAVDLIRTNPIGLIIE